MLSNLPTGHHYAVIVFGNGSNVTSQIAVRLATIISYVRSYNTAWSSGQILIRFLKCTYILRMTESFF